MTAREVNAFDEMFNMIFDAVSEHKSSESGSPSDIGIGRAPRSTHMSDFFSKMRGHSRKLKWSPQYEEALDRKKVEMELCDTDQQLLEWAMREVFGESKRYEEAARKAISDVAAGKELETMPELQPAIYPHLVAQLIRAFRDKYRDPHLAMSMFDHARHLSIPSYVFGCTTPAYNELIQTRWRCFRDLKGVHDALEEMTVNGVDPDNRTRILVEEVRRQVSERNKWEEESELGSGEVWMMLNKIDELIIRSGLKHKRGTEGQRRSNPADQAWKSAAFKSWASEDDWEFGKWGNESKSATGSWGEGGRRPRSSERWEHNNRRSGDDRPPSEFGKWGNEPKSSWEQGGGRPWSSEVGEHDPR
jgi:hypothetical protein